MNAKLPIYREMRDRQADNTYDVKPTTYVGTYVCFSLGISFFSFSGAKIDWLPSTAAKTTSSPRHTMDWA